MSDSYQAVYDAVRSRISGGNIGDAVREVAREALDMSYPRAMVQEQIAFVGMEMARPSVLMRPRIFLDGDKWCALYGDNLQDGVAGFGDSAAEAMADFDKSWNETSTTKIIRERLAQERAANGQFGVGA